MSSQALDAYEPIENPVFVDAYDESERLDLIVPERTIIKYGAHNFHIYKACYLKKNKVGSYARVVKSSLCLKRCKIVKEYIRLCRKTPKGCIIQVLGMLNWLDDNSRSDLIYSEEAALQTYYIYSEALHREARGSAIKGKARARSVLVKLQYGMQFFLSISSGLRADTLKNSALKIDSIDVYEKSQKRPASESDMKAFWIINLRHFEATSSFLLNKEKKPLVIPREDIGYPDYKQWTMRVDSLALEMSKKGEDGGNARWISQFFDEDDNFIFDEDAAKARARQLGHYRYMGQNHRITASKIKNDDEFFTLHLFRKAGIHFCHLLLMASGCNIEQLAKIDFSQPLSNTPEAKRQAVTKAKAGYIKKPVQFSSKFLPIWRKYLKLRALTIDTYDPGFGDLGIPLISEQRYRVNKKFLLAPASANLINIVTLSSFGFPDDINLPLSKSGRDFKTTNFLDLTKGDINLVSRAVSRTPDVTRKSYNYKSFEDSAKELTAFFGALTKAASIKAEGYSPAAPISESGARIHTGSCEAKDETPMRIQGASDAAPEPRCGAPVTCFFCVHFSHHADIQDIKLILSAKVWLQKQTKAISRNVDEHVSKFLPIIERIEDIIEDFKNTSKECSLIYETALSEVEAGNYSRYWRNKIDALIAALEA